MQIENLEEAEVNALEEKLKVMQQNNPSITFRSFAMEEKDQPEAWSIKFQAILDKVERLERKLDLIFSDHVLIGGQFKQINP